MDELEIDHEPHDAGDHAFRVVAKGELDAASAPRLEAQFDDLIQRGATMVVLDASHLHFVDSSGLRSIVAANEELESRGGQMVIDGMSPAMERVLEVTGLLQRYRDRS